MHNCRYKEDFDSVFSELMSNQILTNKKLIDDARKRRLRHTFNQIFEHGKRQTLIDADYTINAFTNTVRLNQHTFTINEQEFEFTRGMYYKKIKILSTGVGFGEIALLENCKRTATIKVHSKEAKLAILEKHKFKESLNHIKFMSERYESEQKEHAYEKFF